MPDMRKKLQAGRVAALPEEEKLKLPRDWCTIDGIERDRKRQSHGDRWSRTGDGLPKAIQDIRREDERTGTFRTKKERNKLACRAAREAGDIMYTSLLWLAWTPDFC